MGLPIHQQLDWLPHPPGLKEFALQVGRPMRDSTLPCRGTWMFIPIQELLGNHSDEGVC